jgi:hypothetical protein
MRRALQPSGGGAVVPPPVVRELEVIRAFSNIEGAANRVRDHAVAVDLPEAWNQMEIRQQRVGNNAVVEGFALRVVAVKGERARNGMATGKQGPCDGAGAKAPDGLAVFLEHAAHDAGQQHDDVLHVVRRHAHPFAVVVYVHAPISENGAQNRGAENGRSLSPSLRIGVAKRFVETRGRDQLAPARRLL